MRLAKFYIVIIFVFSSFCVSNSSYSYIGNQTTLNDNDDYIIVKEYHDGLWWLVYYTDDGLKVMEVPDPWQ